MPLPTTAMRRPGAGGIPPWGSGRKSARASARKRISPRPLRPPGAGDRGRPQAAQVSRMVAPACSRKCRYCGAARPPANRAVPSPRRRPSLSSSPPRRGSSPGKDMPRRTALAPFCAAAPAISSAGRLGPRKVEFQPSEAAATEASRAPSSCSCPAGVVAIAWGAASETWKAARMLPVKLRTAAVAMCSSATRRSPSCHIRPTRSISGCTSSSSRSGWLRATEARTSCSSSAGASSPCTATRARSRNSAGSPLPFAPTSPAGIRAGGAAVWSARTSFSSSAVGRRAILPMLCPACTACRSHCRRAMSSSEYSLRLVSVRSGTTAP